MSTKQNGAEAAKMTEAELSKRLGSYQTQSVLGTWVGLIAVIGGVISYFVVDHPAVRAILTAVLFFGGIGCAIFVAGGAQKKIKALMQSQLGYFFRTELEKAFGPELNDPALSIDEPLMKTMHVMEDEWEECQVENLHLGRQLGVGFSAANVRLDHVYERSIPHEGLETCRETVFKGLVLRCETRISAPSFRTDMPQFTETLQELERRMNGRVLGACWEKNVFSLALETDYEFAAVGSSVDLRDLDAVRSSYIESLRKMGKILNLLLQNDAFFAGTPEKEEEL